MRKSIFAVTLALLVVVALAPAALAQYNQPEPPDVGGTVIEDTDSLPGNDSAVLPSADSGVLPFTGAQVAVIVLAGAVMIAAGFVLVRTAGRRRST